MLSTSAENTIKAVNAKKNKPAHLLFKGTKGCPPMMNVGQMLDPRINLGDHPKILSKNGHKIIVSLLSFLGSTFPKKQLLPCTIFRTLVKYHNVKLGNIEVNSKRFVLPPKVRPNEYNIVNFEHGIMKVFKQTDTTQIN